MAERVEQWTGLVRVVGCRADGEEFPLEVSISRLDHAGGRFYTAILRDITERKRAEEALRESEARFQATLDRPLTLPSPTGRGEKW